MNSSDWRDRPASAHFGSICWQSRLLALLTAIFARPVLATLTVIGIVINRFSPHLLQRARLDVIDKPLRVVPPPAGTQVTPVALPQCPAEWVVFPTARQSDRVIVYFHGSALVTLGLNSHRRFVGKLSQETGARVFNVGYRLAPQARLEDAVSDGLDAYRYVMSLGFSADRIVLAGDSAGGMVAAGTALAARDSGLPVPAGQALMSPLTSSDMGLKYRALKDHRDVMFPFMTVKFLYDVFGTVNGTRAAPVMPSEADLHGLGPFLLQVGTHEMLLNDTLTLADRLRAHGVPVWVQQWHKAMHMFQLGFDVNPDALRAVEEVAMFIRHLTTAPEKNSA
ncbi:MULTISPECIES: alpha/beta hydrolase [Mycobacteriaceae]|uniref:Alpha/beta hydrolase n=11 Tax=Mycobacteriaceae TaxID=1762 RepID=A0A557WWB3_9MYCO|nr:MULTISPECIES: alpha/beta hydrolase [Mycobacteriaceae]KRQ35555.1 esterase [Mycobacteroides sp. H101]KRQ39970.1 esterase [Mycobacteroides sp. H092]KRQ43032.1 esterase [Mycobacteroides sp. H063]KRQ51996.1 esterase [Mycobacteroides sp. HXVII]KRQ56054.1 esterase [Mycobacteroides sp. H079]KRQ75704.1 esterase [Mycobacteroides sp. H110]KRQ85554.1 esterase [Mycobacteroides sp. HXXIII]OHU29549.1 esterase [Mycobacteroides chelonae]PJE01058.1 MAG: alpha/beta hydrolase [Mycobacterium sp.]